MVGMPANPMACAIVDGVAVTGLLQRPTIASQRLGSRLKAAPPHGAVTDITGASILDRSRTHSLGVKNAGGGAGGNAANTD